MKIRTVVLLVIFGLLLVAAAAFRILITRDVDGTLSFAFPEEQYLMYRLVPLASAFTYHSSN